MTAKARDGTEVTLATNPSWAPQTVTDPSQTSQEIESYNVFTSRESLPITSSPPAATTMQNTQSGTATATLMQLSSTIETNASQCNSDNSTSFEPINQALLQYTFGIIIGILAVLLVIFILAWIQRGNKLKTLSIAPPNQPHCQRRSAPIPLTEINHGNISNESLTQQNSSWLAGNFLTSKVMAYLRNPETLVLGDNQEPSADFMVATLLESAMPEFKDGKQK
ncbi:hypothetical protein HK100_003918 [Physocladia obscura]|uniref:Uncharacterized protein n=1 Tax=Physocladia obscura TaxID=109957 RepID=A0AAD5XJ78_9FUNG|nr:hypothetical protein HK100_003918 [Physocladia obscura]